MARSQAQHAGDGNKRDNQRNLPRPWSLTTLDPFVAFVTFCKKVSAPSDDSCSSWRHAISSHAGAGNKRDNQRNLPRPWSLTTLNPFVAFVTFVTFWKKSPPLPIASVPLGDTRSLCTPARATKGTISAICHAHGP
jgi:hypothetical protein